MFGIVNGKCVNDPRSKASDINSNSLSELEIATNRDIIEIALANLMVSFILLKGRVCWTSKAYIYTSHGVIMSITNAVIGNFGKIIHQ